MQASGAFQRQGSHELPVAKHFILQARKFHAFFDGQSPFIFAINQFATTAILGVGPVTRIRDVPLVVVGGGMRQATGRPDNSNTAPSG